MGYSICHIVFLLAEVTRDFVSNITNPERRRAMLLPWIPADFKHISYQQSEPDPEFFGVSIVRMSKSFLGEQTKLD